MKIIDNLTKIEVGKIYHWDAKKILTRIHKDTKTVKVLNTVNRINASPLADVQSIETNEIFSTDIGYLQLNPDYLKGKYYKLMRYYRKYKPDMIFKYTSFFDTKTQKYIIIGNQPEVNNVLALDQEGIVHGFNYSFIEKLNLKRNVSFDRQQEDEMREYYQDYCDDIDY
ncbi:MAG: hypothetical protein WC123_07260 [Bacilli bacterium]